MPASGSGALRGIVIRVNGRIKVGITADMADFLERVMGLIEDLEARIRSSRPTLLGAPWLGSTIGEKFSSSSSGPSSNEGLPWASRQFLECFIEPDHHSHPRRSSRAAHVGLCRNLTFAVGCPIIFFLVCSTVFPSGP